MKKSMVLSVLVGLISTGAVAEEWRPVGQFGLTGVGQTIEIEPGHIYWLGQYTGTFFSDQGEKGLLDRAGVKCPSWADIDITNKKIIESGYCIMTDVNGDKAIASYQGSGAPPHTTGTWNWKSGTGKYKDIKGANTYGGNSVVNWPDGSVSGYATWNK